MKEHSAVQLYLELLKKTILHEIWIQNETERSMRLEGLDWPQFAHSMIGRFRMENIQHCLTIALKEGIEGDFIETGVWRGGACIFARGVLKAYDVTDRKVWVADSFQGLPESDVDKYPLDGSEVHTLHTFDYLKVSLEQVKENFRRYGLLDDQVGFIKGWFEDTLPVAPVEKLAVLRLDGDMYGSTIVSLRSLYPKLSPGGFVIIDDYNIPNCAAAVADYRKEMGIEEPMLAIDRIGVYWRKAKS
ncbi:TylF/MycF/NovP-related O-methyltransferase [Paenibacillus thalictri]|uniref:Macrocin O-methyltransferase n=1 Tax=Paenibacillus thalictri TaxID=2527873 RepID=A0A4Q9DPS6_9BACL|nr:TylF/MycF/NovP-related O-methyltransferase [Paenibacillus thalictri]TBL75265.1 macrocin O-methyltransferase [Paenibacillus thalictri]